MARSPDGQRSEYPEVQMARIPNVQKSKWETTKWTTLQNGLPGENSKWTTFFEFLLKGSRGGQNGPKNCPHGLCMPPNAKC